MTRPNAADGMPRLLLGLVWGSVLMTWVGFLLPWARLTLHQPGAFRAAMHDLGRVTVTIHRGEETVTSDLSSLAEIPTQVSGWQIPRLAHQQNAQVAIAALEVLTNQRHHLGLKSYAVYLIPGIALVSGIVLTVIRQEWIGSAITALVCAGIAGVGFWKLDSPQLSARPVAITIGPGLWVSVWAYVGLALFGGLLSLRGMRIDPLSADRLR